MQDCWLTLPLDSASMCVEACSFGDARTDAFAAHRARMRAVMVNTGRWSKGDSLPTAVEARANLAEAVRLILDGEARE